MATSSNWSSLRILPLLSIGLCAAATSNAATQPGTGRFMDQSLASQLVQQMAQRRIFEADDKVDAACNDREFLQAAVVLQPVAGHSGGVDTRTWQEDWTLRRCDKNVLYRVFYSEVGRGGVTVSVASHDALANPRPVQVVTADPGFLSLQRPPIRGAQVTAVQNALIKAGASIKADGVYGPNTEKAVMRFQQAQGLPANGTVDKKTREALGLI